jgi:hypothetical protein
VVDSVVAVVFDVSAESFPPPPHPAAVRALTTITSDQQPGPLDIACQPYLLCSALRSLVMRPSAVGLLCAAACGTAVLASGCGDSGKGTKSPASDTNATEQKPTKPQPAAVAAALKARLESSLQLQIQTIACTPQGGDFACRVKGVALGQPRSGTLTLKAQGATGTVFLGGGKLAGSGGNIKLRHLAVDLSQPAPRKPALPPGRSQLEQQMDFRLRRLDPRLIISKVDCPQGKATGKGATFTCKANATLGVNPATITVHVVQTDSAGKQFVLSGEIVNPDRGEKYGSFRKVKLVVP